MYTYTILPHTYKNAKQIGVIVEPSHRKNKKINIYSRSNKYITSVGARGMNDYPTYIKNCGLKYAKTRRRLYKKRHQTTRLKKYSNSWYADKLLWN